MLGGVHGQSTKVIVNSNSVLKCDQTVVPSEMVLGKTAYTLVATVYLGGAHFTCLGKHLVENQYYHHDGMDDSARWIKMQTKKSFPLTVKGNNVDHALYVMTKYLKFA